LAERFSGRHHAGRKSKQDKKL